MENFGKFCFIIISIVSNICLRGYVLSKLWFWFIVSTFGAPAITIYQALGLSLLFSFLTMNIKRETVSESKGFDKLVEVFFVNLFSALAFLLFGWILYSFF